MRSSVRITWESRLSLDKAAPTPLYYQLKERLRANIADVGPGIQIPSEQELMQFAGVSRQTTRRATSDLVHEGLLRSEQGRGTFTCASRVETDLSGLRGFTETIVEAGHVPTTRVVDLKKTVVEDAMARQLGIEVGSRVWVLRRLRLIDGEPAMLEVSHIPVQIAPQLDEEDLTSSLYHVFEDVYGLKPFGGREVIVAIAAEPDVAELLRVEAGVPMLFTTRTTTAADARVLDFVTRHARGDLCSFNVSLDRESALTRRPGSSGLAL